jgi:uncharacterized protein (TIGR01615 family)
MYSYPGALEPFLLFLICYVQLQADVERFARQCYLEEGKYDTVILASKLAGVGYRVTTREAVGGGTDFLHNLRHTFLFVLGETSTPESPSLTLVEPCLRDHFEISSPPPAYKQLLDSLPLVFVGDKPRLTSLVTLLCQEMALAFCASGRMLPPWRQCRSMLSKWFPGHMKDTDVATAYCSGSTMQSVKPPPEAPVGGDNWVPFQFGSYANHW